jgi:hypothetical protein
MSVAVPDTFCVTVYQNIQMFTSEKNKGEEEAHLGAILTNPASTLAQLCCQYLYRLCKLESCKLN